MIKRYVFGNPFDTQAILTKIESEKKELPFFNKSGNTFTYAMDKNDIIWGLGENVRGMNKRGHTYVSWCSDEFEHSEEKKSLYGAHNFFVIDGKMDQTPSPRINTNSLIQCYPTFQRTGQTQIIDGCIFLSMSDYDKLMLHHGTATWVDCKVDGKGHKPSKFNDFIRDPKKFVFLEKHFGQKAVDIYEFLTYDLRDYGLMYYIKRKFLKIKSKKQ